MRIRTTPLREISVGRFQSMRPIVQLDPPYQRESDVWRTETQAVLIDSIINGLDVPKLYFEEITEKRRSPSGLEYEYAVIDGKQRLGSILAFADNQLRLADDFYFFENDDVNAAGMTLRELDEHYPEVADRFWAFELPIVVVRANSGDLVEEMFQRLNASTSLNAAEKRNSIDSPTRTAVNNLAMHELLTNRSPIRSARYKYRELAAKFLAIEHQLDKKGKLENTKAATLLELFRATRPDKNSITSAEMDGYADRADETLSAMALTFEENDPLLRSIGTVVVYYIAFRSNRFASRASREKLQAFEDARRAAAQMSDMDPQYAVRRNVRLRDYNVLVQSTNDGSALARRAQILESFIEHWSPADPFQGLDALGDETPDTDESE